MLFAPRDHASAAVLAANINRYVEARASRPAEAAPVFVPSDDRLMSVAHKSATVALWANGCLLAFMLGLLLLVVVVAILIAT